MSELFFGSLSLGILSWFWALLSSKLRLITWIGFFGCTSYYASGGKLIGLKKSILCNLTGVFWAACTIFGSTHIIFPQISAILIGIFSFVMCYQARNKKLSFIPGTFIGACSTFGSNNNYILVATSLFCGAFVGYFSDLGGKYLYNKYTNNKK